MRIALVYSLLLSAFLFSCKNEADNKMQVEGKVINSSTAQALMLEVVESDKPAPRTIDTVAIAKGSSDFFLNGLTGNSQNLYRLKFSDREQYVMLVSDVKKINITIDLNDISKYSTNSPASNSLHNLLLSFNTVVVRLDSLRKPVLELEPTVQKDDSALLERKRLFNEQVDQTERFLLGYADTTKSYTVALYALGLGRGQISADKMEPVMTNLARRFANVPEVISITTEYFNYIQRSKQGDLTGKAAPEISLPDPEGKTITLSSLRGKYVLVDFWASWCRPCREENPNVVEAYNQFKDRNFTVLGVSLDREKSNWVKAIKEDGLTWTHISDLKFWNSEVVPLYNIEGIPFNVLIDPEGKIVTSNLRGPALKQKLEQILN